MESGLLAVCIMALGLNPLMLRPEALQRSVSNPKVSLVTGRLRAQEGAAAGWLTRPHPAFQGLHEAPSAGAQSQRVGLSPGDLCGGLSWYCKDLS